MSVCEFADRKKSEEEPENESGILDSQHAYLERYREVSGARSAWYPAVVEAEAVFKDTARKKIEALDELVRKLIWAIETYHREQRRRVKGAQHQHLNECIYQQCENIIFGVHPGMAEAIEDKRILMMEGFRSN